VRAASDFILSKVNDPIGMAVVLGSGLDSVKASMDIIHSIRYQDIPGFPEVTVHGHMGELYIGKINGTRALIMSGRAHFYESGSMLPMVTQIRTLCECGIDVIVLTNAAGSVSPELLPGDIMLIHDHVCFPGLMGHNPLIEAVAGSDDKFVSMSEVYDPEIIVWMGQAAHKIGFRHGTGIYAMVSGPNYETPAEVEMLRKLGVSAVGMSTAAEAIVARHCGVRVAGLSVITNIAGHTSGNGGHESIVQMSQDTSCNLQKLVSAVGERLNYLDERSLHNSLR